LKQLSSANALFETASNRRQAMWNASGSVPDIELLREAQIVEEAMIITPGAEGQ
jgi:error-prone DNA polymerase